MLINTGQLFSCFFSIPPKLVHHHRFKRLEPIFQGRDMAMGAGLSTVILVGNDAFDICDATFCTDIMSSLLYVALENTQQLSVQARSCG